MADAQQIRRKYAEMIRDGVLTAGDRLPTVRALAEQEGVATATAHAAIRHLVSARLVTVRPGVGTFVTGRIERTPWDRLAAITGGGAARLRAEQVTVTDAGVVAASGDWEYIAGILGLDPGNGVIRRQSVTRAADGAPVTLAVSWHRPELAAPVPELLAAQPVPSPGGEIGLIMERTGRAVTRTEESYEARVIKDDGREGPLLGLPAGSPCLAGVYLWADQGGVLEYGEFVLPPGRVISYQHDLT